VIDVIDRVLGLGTHTALLPEESHHKRLAAGGYAREHGADIPAVNDWVWPDARGAATKAKVRATAATGGDN
jgi:xylulose-5-phosphate/fructose-6-phosphate phosphoketolase